MPIDKTNLGTGEKMSTRIADKEGEEIGAREMRVYIMSEWAEVMGVEARVDCRCMFGERRWYFPTTAWLLDLTLSHFS